MDRDTIRKNLNRYTALAFNCLPAMDHPRILDIGCGTGIPTLLLAELSNGHITGIDSDAYAIRMLQGKIRQYGLGERVTAEVRSFNSLLFSKESFNLVWSEGAVHFIGFKEGINAWGELVKDKGFLVIHDELGHLKRKLEIIHSSSFHLLGYFVLSETTWEKEYCRPLQALLDNDPHYRGTEEGKKAKTELGLFRKNPESFRSAFFIMQRR